MYEIKLKTHEEAELYNALDPDGMLLADNVVSYIHRKYEERVRRNIRRYTEQEGKITARKQRRNRVKQLWLTL